MMEPCVSPEKFIDRTDARDDVHDDDDGNAAAPTQRGIKNAALSYIDRNSNKLLIVSAFIALIGIAGLADYNHENRLASKKFTLGKKTYGKSAKKKSNGLRGSKSHKSSKASSKAHDRWQKHQDKLNNNKEEATLVDVDEINSTQQQQQSDAEPDADLIQAGLPDEFIEASFVDAEVMGMPVTTEEATPTVDGPDETSDAAADGVEPSSVAAGVEDGKESAPPDTDIGSKENPDRGENSVDWSAFANELQGITTSESGVNGDVNGSPGSTSTSNGIDAINTDEAVEPSSVAAASVEESSSNINMEEPSTEALAPIINTSTNVDVEEEPSTEVAVGELPSTETAVGEAPLDDTDALGEADVDTESSTEAADAKTDAADTVAATVEDGKESAPHTDNGSNENPDRGENSVDWSSFANELQETTTSESGVNEDVNGSSGSTSTSSGNGDVNGSSGSTNTSNGIDAINSDDGVKPLSVAAASVEESSSNINMEEEPSTEASAAIINTSTIVDVEEEPSTEAAVGELSSTETAAGEAPLDDADAVGEADVDTESSTEAADANTDAADTAAATEEVGKDKESAPHTDNGSKENPDRGENSFANELQDTTTSESGVNEDVNGSSGSTSTSSGNGDVNGSSSGTSTSSGNGDVNGSSSGTSTSSGNGDVSASSSSTITSSGYGDVSASSSSTSTSSGYGDVNGSSGSTSTSSGYGDVNGSSGSTSTSNGNHGSSDSESGDSSFTWSSFANELKDSFVSIFNGSSGSTSNGNDASSESESTNDTAETEEEDPTAEETESTEEDTLDQESKTNYVSLGSKTIGGDPIKSGFISMVAIGTIAFLAVGLWTNMKRRKKEKQKEESAALPVSSLWPETENNNTVDALEDDASSIWSANEGGDSPPSPSDVAAIGASSRVAIQLSGMNTDASVISGLTEDLGT